MSRILIGIQARSGSTRLPRKAFELIAGQMLLDHVIKACKRGAQNAKQNLRLCPSIEIAVLTPKNDPIATEFKDRCHILHGPEDDVLTRYVLASAHFDPDYIVRVTGDCPLLPPFVVSKLITLAQMRNYDYVSNVDEPYRTALDGADCEVMSKRLLGWLDETAATPFDREHVTTLARREPPDWAKIGVAVHHYDHSDQKLSVDTREDLERVRAHFDLADGKYKRAVLRYGNTAVHRI